MSTSTNCTEHHQPWLERFCYLSLLVASLLLLLGGETTSNGAGMAFPTWPSSNGSLNPPGWLENLNMFLEHSHRLLAGATSTLTIIAAIWVQLTEARQWVRRLAWILVGVIFLQAILGGLRVLLDNSVTHADTNTAAYCLRVAHAMTAEITVLLWVTLTVAVSHGWMVRGVGTRPVAPSVRRWGHIACAVIFLQIFMGAVMRHGGYALTIPTFPYSTLDGHLLPAGWGFPIAINFAHRVGACVVTITIIGLAISVFGDEPARRQLGSWMMIILLTVAVQIALGAEVIWSNKNPNVATAHLLTGAFLLASTWLLTFLAYRSKWWPGDVSKLSGLSQPSPLSPEFR